MAIIGNTSKTAPDARRNTQATIALISDGLAQRSLPAGRDSLNAPEIVFRQKSGGKERLPPPVSDNRASSAEQPHEKQHNGDDQQNVNERRKSLTV